MSALALRIIACVCMLLDHIGYFFGGRYPFLTPLRWIGRIAFPLYVFLIVNGFRHTSNRPRYALRLAIFAVISQVPFALMSHPGKMLGTLNVFVTLLLALLTVWATDAMRKHRYTKYVCFLPTLAVFCLYYFGLIHSDYGAKGILLAMTFYLFDGKRVLTALGMLVSIYHPYLISLGFALLHLLQGRQAAIQPLSEWELTQLFSLLSLVFIFLYNGKKGRLPASRVGAKAVQLGFYAFYPAHMLLLYALKQLL
ncbi:MAG: hypothetical protein IJG45_02240 [Oscillospiraceae bacterium]|nr:hypothetical protein [Oscillospiraceae bacterium]